MNFGRGLLFLLWLGMSASQAAPVELVLPGLDGADYRLSDQRGKWVVVNFWATWCPPCIKELPELDGFHNKHKDRLATVLGVNMESIEPDELRTFMEKHKVSFPVVRMEPAVKTPLGKVIGMPTTFLVDPQGEVVVREVGAVTAEAIEAVIERYQAQGAKVKP